MSRTVTIGAILALTITAAQAGSVTVRFSDLDLSRASDTQVLAGRVHAAAVSACASEIQNRNPVSLHYRLERDRCIANASTTLSAEVLAMSRQPTKLAGK